MILKNQATNKLELERHIKELKGLQSVGQSLSAILDEDQIAEAIYREVSKLMPTDNFYLALYLPEDQHDPLPDHLRAQYPAATPLTQLRQWPDRICDPDSQAPADREECQTNGRIDGDETLWARGDLLAGCPSDRRGRGSRDDRSAILPDSQPDSPETRIIPTWKS